MKLMKFGMLLIVGFCFCVSQFAMAQAGYDTQLVCLKACVPNIKVSLKGDTFVYSEENNCTKCCDNTFGRKYGNCQALKKACINLCKAKRTFPNCSEICETNKELCEERNAVKRSFSCPGN